MTEKFVLGSVECLEQPGDGTRIHSGCLLSFSALGRDVFSGPSVTFTDRHGRYNRD